MLFGEDLGRRHEGHLVTVLDGLQRGERGDDGFAAAHVAEQQALHRVRLRQVARDLLPYFLLCASEFERQLPEQCLGQCALRRQGGRKVFVALAVMHAHRELLCQQLVELDAPPGGVAARLQRGRGDVRWRVVQQAQTFAKVGEAQSFQQRCGQGIGERERIQRVGDELAQDGL